MVYNELNCKLDELRGELISQIKSIANKKGYPIFRYKKEYPINLNIWGIRAIDKTTDIFNDTMIVFWETISGSWIYYLYNITTDPGKYYLLNPINKKGTAILKEGFYRGMWKIGYHKGNPNHKALIQVGPCTVIRDANRDSNLDFDGKEDTGYFGINCHRNTRNKIIYYIGKYSAGCQVHQDSANFEKHFIPFVDETLKGSTVSYTLVNEKDFKLD